MRFSILPRSLPRRLTDPIALAVARTGVTPNMVTAAGFAGNVLAAVLVARGMFLAGGALVLAASALDLLDGALARATGRATPFGAVFDAVLDRCSEAAVLFGLLLHYQDRGETTPVTLAFAAVTGSILVSYVRARAEIAGLNLKEGFFTRAERVLVLGLGLILGLAVPALWLLAVLTNLTALQRLYLVWRGLTRPPDGAGREGVP
ncbi:MAG TPA: CDP-alcohol phosphatidyltransferase family protein [Natronosporangium sp.]